eukprot:TRINITY_DN8836_c0_g1_i1.p1 TRINITY_DN8836_c0_g1~~TRINITY_DN8836_c0_g1_i1.p1  ORF type:complete len:1232 (-),score=294.88 TRINITY_DN8836_c0_g1_i1:112-3807(-)
MSVSLNIYDLSLAVPSKGSEGSQYKLLSLKKSNDLTSLFGFGLFGCTVEAFGREYYFGPKRGLTSVSLESLPGLRTKTLLDGATTNNQFVSAVSALSNRYSASSFDPIRKNSFTFASALCKRLGKKSRGPSVSTLPFWISSYETWLEFSSRVTAAHSDINSLPDDQFSVPYQEFLMSSTNSANLKAPRTSNAAVLNALWIFDTSVSEFTLIEDRRFIQKRETGKAIDEQHTHPIEFSLFGRVTPPPPPPHDIATLPPSPLLLALTHFFSHSSFISACSALRSEYSLRAHSSDPRVVMDAVKLREEHSPKFARAKLIRDEALVGKKQKTKKKVGDGGFKPSEEKSESDEELSQYKHKGKGHEMIHHLMRRGSAFFQDLSESSREDVDKSAENALKSLKLDEVLNKVFSGEDEEADPEVASTFILVKPYVSMSLRKFCSDSVGSEWMGQLCELHDSAAVLSFWVALKKFHRLKGKKEKQLLTFTKLYETYLKPQSPKYVHLSRSLSSQMVVELEKGDAASPIPVLKAARAEVEELLGKVYDLLLSSPLLEPYLRAKLAEQKEVVEEPVLLRLLNIIQNQAPKTSSPSRSKSPRLQLSPSQRRKRFSLDAGLNSPKRVSSGEKRKREHKEKGKSGDENTVEKKELGSPIPMGKRNAEDVAKENDTENDKSSSHHHHHQHKYEVKEAKKSKRGSKKVHREKGSLGASSPQFSVKAERDNIARAPSAPNLPSQEVVRSNSSTRRQKALSQSPKSPRHPQSGTVSPRAMHSPPSGRRNDRNRSRQKIKVDLNNFSKVQLIRTGIVLAYHDQTLQSHLEDEDGFKYYHQFLKAIGEGQHLDFVKEVHGLEAIMEIELPDYIASIMSTYVAKDSPCPIDIPDSSRASYQIKFETGRLKRSFFEPLLQEMFTKLETEYATAYAESAPFHEWVEAKLADPTALFEYGGVTPKGRLIAIKEDEHQRLIELTRRRLQRPGGVPVKTIKFMLKSYPEVFKGKHLVSWLVSNLDEVSTRAQAVELSQKLMWINLIEGVKEGPNFKDGAHLYRFTVSSPVEEPDHLPLSISSHHTEAEMDVIRETYKSETLADHIKSDDGREAFRAYAVSEVCEESVDFLHHIDKLGLIPDDDEDQIQTMCIRILNRFLTDKYDQEVNLDTDVKDEILTKRIQRKYSKTMFKKAQIQVRAMLIDNQTFERYKTSTLYEWFLTSVAAAESLDELEQNDGSDRSGSLSESTELSSSEI